MWEINKFLERLAQKPPVLLTCHIFEPEIPSEISVPVDSRKLRHFANDLSNASYLPGVCATILHVGKIKAFLSFLPDSAEGGSASAHVTLMSCWLSTFTLATFTVGRAANMPFVELSFLGGKRPTSCKLRWRRRLAFQEVIGEFICLRKD